MGNHKFEVYISNEMRERLRDLSEQTKLPMAELVRRGIQREIDWHEDEDGGRFLSVLEGWSGSD